MHPSSVACFLLLFGLPGLLLELKTLRPQSNDKKLPRSADDLDHEQRPETPSHPLVGLGRLLSMQCLPPMTTAIISTHILLLRSFGCCILLLDVVHSSGSCSVAAFEN